MNTRLLTVALALALAALAGGLALFSTSASARQSYGQRHTHWDSDDDYERQAHATRRAPRAYAKKRRRHLARPNQRQRAAWRKRHRHHVKRGARQRTAMRTRARRLAKRGLGQYARAGAGTSRSCLTPAARALLGRIEAQFGTVQIISTCRPGAVIATSGRPSKHASGQAIDFNAPSGRKAEVVRWLIANHKSGGTMTYRDMGHIHVDVGQRFVSLGAYSGR